MQLLSRASLVSQPAGKTMLERVEAHILVLALALLQNNSCRTASLGNQADFVHMSSTRI